MTLRAAYDRINYHSLKAHSLVSLLQSNRRMRDSKPESNNAARMQEELTSVRMREAEANLSMKELRKRVADLETEWQV